MFYIESLGRKRQHDRATTLEELGQIVTRIIENMAFDAICVAVGLNEDAVMPYVWIRRDPETDRWIGDPGDCIKLGIENDLIEEW